MVLELNRSRKKGIAERKRHSDCPTNFTSFIYSPADALFPWLIILYRIKLDHTSILYTTIGRERSKHHHIVNIHV